MRSYAFEAVSEAMKLFEMSIIPGCAGTLTNVLALSWSGSNLVVTDEFFVARCPASQAHQESRPLGKQEPDGHCDCP